MKLLRALPLIGAVAVGIALTPGVAVTPSSAGPPPVSIPACAQRVYGGSSSASRALADPLPRPNGTHSSAMSSSRDSPAVSRLLTPRGTGRPPASLCSVKHHACWRSCTTRHRITIGVSRKSRRRTKQPSSRNLSWSSGCPRACASSDIRSATLQSFAQFHQRNE